MVPKWFNKQTYRHLRDTLLLSLNPNLLIERRFGFLKDIKSDFGKNKWVEPEFLIAQALVQKSSAQTSFFDVGANKGVYEFIISQVLPEHCIYAFEPIPQLNRVLKKMFPKVNISSYALSDSVQNLEFKIPYLNGKRMWTRATLNTDFSEDGETNFDLIKVQTYTLDKFVVDNNIKNIGVIKIDVEGNEWAVLKGGEKTLEEFHPDLIVEIEQRHHPDLPISKIIQYVLDIGYTGVYFDSNLRELLVIDDPQIFHIQDMSDLRSSDYVNNFIFLANSRNPIALVSALNDELFGNS